MLIKGIKLKKFRQYRNVDLSFSTDPDKNLTVILGENGYGKTTLVKSFIWCLYRDNKLFNNPILLNDDVAKYMKANEEETVSVTLDLEHAGSKYRITTIEKYKKSRNGTITVSSKASTSMIKNGNNVYQGAVDLEISKILRKDVKDYFFYDGENNTIENMSKKSSLKDAVSQMMGIRRLEELASYFQPAGTTGVVGTLTKQLCGDDIGLQPLQDDYEDACKEKQDLLNRIKHNKNEIEKLDNQKKEKQAIIDANKDVAEDQLHLKTLTKQVTTNQGKVDGKFNGIIKQISGKGNPLLKLMFANCYTKYEFNKLEEDSSFGSEESLSHISEEAIDQLIARGKCLCGALITNENDAYKHLIEAKSHMEPHDFGKYLSDFCSTENSNVIYLEPLKQILEM